ncbi:hypothetical protein ACVBEQ_05275 [Nakamurella sp. GG22]
MNRLATEPRGHSGSRTGTALPGFTVPTVVTALIWRTFGHSANRARSILDWAGLQDQPAGPIGDLADHYATTTATIRSRVRRASIRGANLPLTPRVLYDATRSTQPTDDALGRERCAHLLGIPGPTHIDRP